LIPEAAVSSARLVKWESAHGEFDPDRYRCILVDRLNERMNILYRLKN